MVRVLQTKAKGKKSVYQEFTAESKMHHFDQDDDVRHRIALKAYELYMQRGCESGREMEDWLEAERIVQEELEKERGR